MTTGMDELTRYWIWKVTRDVKQDLLKIIEAEMHTMKPGMTDGTPVQGGGGNKLDGLIDRKDQLQAEVDYYSRCLDLVEHKVQKLNDREQAVIRHCFMEGRQTVEAVEILRRELYVEERQIYRIRKDAIQHYCNLIDDSKHDSEK